MCGNNKKNDIERQEHGMLNKIHSSRCLLTFLIFVSCLSLIIVSSFFVVKFAYSRGEADLKPIQFVLDTAKTNHSAKSDTLLIVNIQELSDINAIVDTINYYLDGYEKRMDYKYQYLLDEKDTSNKALAVAGFLLSIIVSIVGFFGYRSFSDIEKRVERIMSDKWEDYKKNQLEPAIPPLVDSSVNSEAYLTAVVNSVVDKLTNQQLIITVLKENDGYWDEIVDKVLDKKLVFKDIEHHNKLQCVENDPEEDFK